MADLLWFNGTDAEDLGFVLLDAPDLLGEGERAPQTVSLPQGIGALLSAVPVSVAPRVLKIVGYTTAATVAASKVIHDRVKAAVGSGVVEIRSAWDTALVVRGVLVGHRAAPQSTAWLGRIAVELEFLLPDPLAYAIAPTVVAFTSTPTEISLGTAPSPGRDWWSAIITIVGAATTPTLTEYDATGTVLRTMVFSGWSPTATDAIEVDLGRGLVTRITAGVRTNGMADLTAGFDFPKLDPADGDWYTSAFPMLAVSSGTGSARYYRGYR